MGDRRLDAARRLHALARTGLHFCAGEYDRERYEQIERIAAELLADGEPASCAGARALVTRGGIRHAQDRRARRSVPRRRGAPGPRALRRSLDASRRLGRRGRDALAGRDARDRAGIGHPEPGDLARGAPRPASARVAGPLSQLEGVLSLRDAGRRAARQLRDRCGGVLRRRSSSTDVARAQHPRRSSGCTSTGGKQPLPADFD